MEEAFTALGAIILFGFLGRAAYDRTRIPESILMIAIGIAMGPVLGFVNASVLMPVVPFVSVFALILVLLDAGLEFNMFKVLREFPSAFAFTLLSGALVTALVGLALHALMGWDLMGALFVGLLSSGTTTVAAMTLLELMRVQERTKSFLFLETVINDFTLIFGASLILALIAGTGIPQDGTGSLASMITMAAVAGLVSGLLWIGVLRRIGLRKYNYIASVGALFLLYGALEAVGGDGIIGTLVFSFVLGNHAGFFRRFRLRGDTPAVREEKRIIRGIRFIHGDISFVVRIFFFVMIGAVFRFENLTADVLVAAAIAIAMILLGRLAGILAVGAVDRDLGKDTFTIVTMIPRGFVATVLAFIPAGMGIVIPRLTEIVLLLVLSTNIIAIAATALHARAGGGKTPDGKDNRAKGGKGRPRKFEK